MKKLTIFGLAILFILIGCNSEKNEASAMLPEGTRKIEVVEHINGGGYTFIKAKENGQEFWIAVREMPVEVGESIYFTTAMEMKNFESKTLNRTFDSILFVDKASKSAPSNNVSNKMPGMASSGEEHTKPKVAPNSNIKVTPLSDGKTIEAVYKNKAELAGKTIKVKGVVTKYNGGIMGKNWLHIQDGTKFGESIDLTITSNQSAKVGDTIIIEGTVALDKDFGAGYFYDVIVENATVTVEKKS